MDKLEEKRGGKIHGKSDELRNSNPAEFQLQSKGTTTN